MSDRPRLKDVDAVALAASLYRSLHNTVADQVALLGQDTISVAVACLADYARGAEIDPSVVERRLEVVGRLYRSAVAPDASIPSIAEPANELELVIGAARARLTLDCGRDISTQELALLAGVNWAYVSQLAARGAIPSAYRVNKEQDKRRPWRFRASKALKQWIADRNR